MSRDPMIAKRGKLVVETAKGLRPATRKDVDGANLVGTRGAIYVETAEGLQPATVGDARSAVGRIARESVKNYVGGFADPAVASRAGSKARATETLSPEQRSARAKKAWETRRRRAGNPAAG